MQEGEVHDQAKRLANEISHDGFDKKADIVRCAEREMYLVNTLGPIQYDSAGRAYFPSAISNTSQLQTQPFELESLMVALSAADYKDNSAGKEKVFAYYPHYDKNGVITAKSIFELDLDEAANLAQKIGRKLGFEKTDIDDVFKTDYQISVSNMEIHNDDARGVILDRINEGALNRV